MKKVFFVMSLFAAMLFTACVTETTKPAEEATGDSTKVETVDTTITPEATAPEVEAPAQEEAPADAEAPAEAEAEK